MRRRLRKLKIFYDNNIGDEYFVPQASDGVDKDVLNSYCWMYSTWNIPPGYKGACSAGSEDRGITLNEWNEQTTTIVYNSYYQWVPLYLIILAFVFYLPRMCWLIMEGGLMEFFGKGTTVRFIEDQEEKRDVLVDFFRKNVHNKYNIYFWGFLSMELFNWLIVLIQFGITNVFLHHKFTNYGAKVIYNITTRQGSIKSQSKQSARG